MLFSILEGLWPHKRTGKKKDCLQEVTETNDDNMDSDDEGS